MRVWKKQTVRYSLNGKTVPKGTHGARKVKILSKRYYGTLNMANGRRRQQPLCEERKSSEILLRRLQAEEDRGHAVGEDSYAAASKKPISNHIDDYREHLISKGNTQKYVSLAVGRVNRILASVNARKISDLEPSSITSRLLVMRTAKKGAISVETSNHYVRAIKSFSRWLWIDRRSREDLLRSIRVISSEGQRRRQRRSLSSRELVHLITVTRNSKRVIRGKTWAFTPEDRAVLYLIAVYTGLRASEIASLTHENLDLENATVCVDAAYSKRRRNDTLPLHVQLVKELEQWLPGKGRGRLFPGTWNVHYKAAKLLRHDLNSAGIPYIDTKGRVVDFHALRHTFVSSLARSGIKPIVAKELARHSTITLTMDVYSHVETEELRDALSQLPGIE